MNQKSAIINFLVLSAPLSIGLFATIILVNPREAWIFLLACSFILIFIGKLSQFKKRKWISFGSKGMDKIQKNLYLSGWFLLILAVAFTAMVKLNA